MFKFSQKACIRAILVLGAFVRIFPWILNRALWYDEALLANNLVNRSFGELLLPLANNQSAPIGYLWLAKLSTLLFGNNEWALRAPSLVAGLLALFFFYQLCKRMFTGYWLVFALAFFAFCDPLIYYTSEFKQYQFDAFFCTLISLCALSMLTKIWDQKAFYRLIMIGVVSVWFSQPAIFVLAGAGLSLLFFHRKNFKRSLSITLGGSIWIFSFGLYFYLFLTQDIGNSNLQSAHQEYFAPLQFWKLENWVWYTQTWLSFFRFPGGILFQTPAGIIGLIGFLVVPRWWRSHQLLFLLPILFAVFASGLQLYSTISRLMLFIVPALIIWMVKGFEFIDGQLQHLFKTPWLSNVVYLAVFVLLLQPIFNCIQWITTDKGVNEIKPILALAQANIKNGEAVYIPPNTIPQFEYYKKKYGLDAYPLLYGKAIFENWKTDIESLKEYDAVWCIFSHDQRDGFNDQEYYIEFFSSQGEIVMERRDKGAGGFLVRTNKE